MALTDPAIRHARPLGKAYRLSDCHGLYIQVNPSGSKLWYLKFRFGNKENRMALGPYPLISLALAREKQADNRALLGHEWLRMLIAPGGSLGGARPKASVADDNGHLYIAKFPSTRDEFDVGGWEDGS